MKNLRALTNAQVARYHAENYRPDNTLLVSSLLIRIPPISSKPTGTLPSRLVVPLVMPSGLVIPIGIEIEVLRQRRRRVP